MHYVTNMFRKTTYKAVNTSVCLLRRRRQRKKPVAAANDEEDIFRSLGDDFRDDDGQPAQQPEMTTWGYTYSRAEWDEWQARKVNETVNTYG